jgi:altronate dehydratase large subunit
MTINGYMRKNGDFGTRNHVLILPTVFCVNGVVRKIVKEVPEAVGINHAYGCSRGGLRDIEILFRMLSGMVHNPNVGGVILVGLGCEVSNSKNLMPHIQDAGKPIEIFNVQDDGGSLKTAEKATVAARQMLEEVNRQQRVPMPWNKLTVSMKCGGSDAMSGVTANTALGAVSDWLVKKGATVMFGENTEMIGADHILKRRAKNEQVAERIGKMVEEAEKLTHDIMGPLAGLVISPGNMDGGMSTIAEKSMGCIFKGGSSTINQVVDYGEVPAEHGLILQDGPGNDGDAMTGMAASGSQLIIFSTGRGTPIGFPILPVIKVSSNSKTYEAMPDDIDINAGILLEGTSLNVLRDRIIEFMIRVINGEKTKAESNEMDAFTFMTVDPPF